MRGDCLGGLVAEGLWFDSAPSAGSGQALRETSGRLATSGARLERAGRYGADEG